MINFRLLKNSDFILWVSVAILVVIGFFMIASTTYSLQIRTNSPPFHYVWRHLFAFFVALIFMALTAYLDYIHYKELSVFIYIFMLAILIGTEFFGISGGGAQRWLNLGIISFQPSEISKLIIIIFLASYFDKKKEEINSVLSCLPIFVLVGIPVFLIFKQPDLGTALVFVALLFGMLAITRSNPFLLAMFLSPVFSIFLRNHILIFILYLIFLYVFMHFGRLNIFDRLFFIFVNIASGYVFSYFFGMLKEYQRMRLLAFFNPSIDPKGIGYHSFQSKVAIGSGGLFGKGLFHGTQTQLQFIPKQFSDFIFSAIGEELGFIGSAFVVILFGIIVWRAIKIASESRDNFGRLLASGIATMFTFQFFINVGMTLGFLPVVGIPLPFISFGGTSLLLNLGAIGILQSICMRRSKILFY